jgi:hypothetical protein
MNHRETHRDRLRPIIARTLAQYRPKQRLRTKRTALRQAYPYRCRRGYVYRVWLDECRIQLGLRPPRFRTLRVLRSSPGQLLLFPPEGSP